MSDALSIFGIDVEDLEWQDLAICAGMDTNLFYDDYESEKNVAIMVDECCLSCPVMAQCLERGIENGERGVWGGIYLVNGKPDKDRNSHKTQDIWEQIRERISESVL